METPEQYLRKETMRIIKKFGCKNIDETIELLEKLLQEKAQHEF